MGMSRPFPLSFLKNNGHDRQGRQKYYAYGNEKDVNNWGLNFCNALLANMKNLMDQPVEGFKNSMDN